MNIIRDKSDVERISATGKKVIIFGCGGFAEVFYDRYFQGASITIDCVVDNDPQKHGTLFYGHKIRPAEKLMEEYEGRADLAIIIMLEFARVDVCAQLDDMGFDASCFYLMLPYKRSGYKPVEDAQAEVLKLEIKHVIELRRKYNAYISIANEYMSSEQFNALKIEETEYDVFSQFGEDGVLRWILNRLEIKNRKFIEFGTLDYIAISNTRLIYLAGQGYDGLLIEGNEKSLNVARMDYRLKALGLGKLIFENSFITKENINSLFEKHGYTGEIALLSVDIDGNDYWIWKEISVISPQVVICEYNIALGGFDNAYTIPYDRDFVHNGDGYFGASPKAMLSLAQGKGYTPVYLNWINIIFVRDDLRQYFRDVDFSSMIGKYVKEANSAKDKRSYWGEKLVNSQHKNAAVVDIESNETVYLSENDIY